MYFLGEVWKIKFNIDFKVYFLQGYGLVLRAV